MNTSDSILKIAKDTILIESDAIANLANLLDEDFSNSVKLILNSKTEAGTALQDHVTHLVVHGILHLLGYDHTRDQDATLMEGLETEILGSMGVDDPYRDSNGAEGSLFGMD